MIKKFLSSSALVKPNQYYKLLNGQINNCQTIKIKQILSFPLPKKENSNFPTIKLSQTRILMNPYTPNNKFNFSTDNKNTFDPILKKSNSIIEKENEKSFNSEQQPKTNYLSNPFFISIVFFIAIYLLNKDTIKNINEANLKLNNDVKDLTNQLNESNKEIKVLINKLYKTNELIIEQNNHQISTQGTIGIISIAFTFLSLIFFIYDFKKKYM